MNELISFATQYGQVQKVLLKEFIVPYALLDNNGKILWMNDAFAKLCGKTRRYRKTVTNLFPDLTKDKLPRENEAEVTFQYDGKDYRAIMRTMSIQRLLEEDEEKHTGLYHTLKVYLICENNITLAAKKLHIHRNTLVYRLKQIEKCLEVDLNDTENSWDLLAFIMMHDMVRRKTGERKER